MELDIILYPDYQEPCSLAGRELKKFHLLASEVENLQILPEIGQLEIVTLLGQ